jgi:hypothetical protein
MKIWDKIIKTGAVLGAVYFILSQIFGGLSFFKNGIIEKERKVQSDLIQQQVVTDLKNITTSIMLNIDTLKISQDKVMVKLDANTKATNAVITGFKKHLKATDRLEELLNFYEF